MLSLLGSRWRWCEPTTRREVLRIGGLASVGLSLPQLLARQAQAAPRRKAAKACILIYMWGGPAHQDTFDLKPEGPAEFRGEFRPIDTTVPGLQISEHFPRLARQAHHLAIVRSVTHTDNNHSTSAHAMLTGRIHPLQRENFGPSADDYPHFGSVLACLRPSPVGMPSFVALPEKIRTTNGPLVPGQSGGILGKKFDPFTIDQHPDEPDFSVPALRLPEDLSPQRMSGRRQLWAQLNQAADRLDSSREVSGMEAFYTQALDMLTAPAVRRAFALDEEDPLLRDRYGRHTFGQSCLLARRLIEAGVRLVTVYWHRDKPGVDTTWDTHAKNFPELKDRLMPQSDAGFATLLDDLDQRGLLEETLVVWTSEFGRTPKINGNGGRDHWGRANSVLFAGGGVPGGIVYGATDRAAAEPSRDPVSPMDIGATLFARMGLHPDDEYYDQLDRPHRVSIGRPIGPLAG